MNHPPRSRLTTLKLTLTLLAGLAALACLVVKARQGAFSMGGGNFALRIGDYLWMESTSPIGVAQCVGAAIFLSFINFRGRERRLEQKPWPVWVQITTAGLALWLALALAWAQVFRLPTLDWLYVLASGVLASMGAWLLFRPGRQGSIPGERPTPTDRWDAGGQGGTRQFILLGLLGAAVAAVSWRWIFQGYALITDAQSQMAQARLLLTGHCRLEVSQALRDVIAFPYALDKTPSYSQFPPGYILPSAAAIGLGLPSQALDLVSAGLLVALTARLAQLVTGKAAGVVAGLLILGSPFFIGMSGSAMNHTLAAAALVGTACCFMTVGVKFWSQGRPGPKSLCLAGGLTLGWALMTRPVTGFAHAITWSAIWLLLLAVALRSARRGDPKKPTGTWRAVPVPRELVRALLWTLAGLALPMAIFMLYNTKTTGNPLRMGYTASNPILHRLGFCSVEGYRFTPRDAIRHLAENLLSLNALMFGWAIGSWTLLGLWWVRTRLRAGELIMLALILAQTGLYTLYKFHDLLLGPRFLYEILPMAAVLGAVALAPTIECGGRRAAVLGCVLVLLTLGGLGEGLSTWPQKFNPIIRPHLALDIFMRRHEPIRQPTVIVIREPYDETVGPYFPSLPGQPPLWFVRKSKETQARTLPDLAGCQWLEMKEN